MKLRQDPLCELCEEQDIVTAATQVHHRKAFHGLQDPLRLDWDNLQSLCEECHRKLERSKQKR
jgi:5-methylcytosine-specific restriction endonuclease McrA